MRSSRLFPLSIKMNSASLGLSSSLHKIVQWSRKLLQQLLKTPTLHSSVPTSNNHRKSMTTDTSDFHVANIWKQYWKYKSYAVPPRKHRQWMENQNQICTAFQKHVATLNSFSQQQDTLRPCTTSESNRFVNKAHLW